jgi:flagellar biogenesis protein FliO
MQRRSKYAWLLLPPVLALIVFLGPLQNLNNSPSPANSASAKTGTSTKTSTNAGTGTNASASKSAGKSTPANSRAEVGSQLPQLPNLWQVSSTLIGVLLLGALFVGLIRKLKENSRSTTGGTLALRQSLRLSAKHFVHAVQYEDQILVLGACDNNVSVLLTSEDQGVAADEAAVLDRDDLEEGAVPRDMILPRSDKPRLKPPKKPRTQTGRPTRTGRPTTTGRPTGAAQAAEAELSEADAKKLADFRTLLKRARAKSHV